MERQKITLLQHFSLDLLDFSNMIYPYSLHFSNNDKGLQIITALLWGTFVLKNNVKTFVN